jgi:formylglycine-generating enzyme required for sulfatase activity
MTACASACARANLLRALAASDAAALATPVALAAMLGFYQQQAGAEGAFAPDWSPAPEASNRADYASAPQPRQVASALPPLPPTSPPLPAPLFGIVAVEVIATVKPEGDVTDNAESPPKYLEPEDFVPRLAGDFAFQPLQPRERLARQLRESLTAWQDGRKVDLARVVAQLARGRVFRHWARQGWPYAPQHVIVLVDHSLHLRPYWDDQQQLVHVLAQWLGANCLTIYTVQADPCQPVACRARGGVCASVPALAQVARQAAGGVALLLTDMGAAHKPGSARWAQAQALLARAGVQVCVIPPASMRVQAWALAQRGVPAPVPACEAFSQVARIEQADPALALLFKLLSCARCIEPTLLRAMRKLAPALQAQVELEARLWACHDLFEIGYDVCVWRVDAVLPWRKAFARLPAAMQNAALLTLRQVHGVCSPLLDVQELLVWAAHVDAKTAAPWRREIDAAKDWLQRLPLARDAAPQAGRPTVNPDALFGIAQQTHAAQGQDDDLIRNYGDAFGPLWGVAHQEAVLRGQQPPSPGALPPSRLHEWCQPAAHTPPRIYRLHQRGLQLVLQAAAAPVPAAVLHQALSAAIGMPLPVSSLAVTPLGTGGQATSASQFTHAQANELAIGPARPGNAFAIHIGNMRLHLAEIVPPLSPLPIRSYGNNDSAESTSAPGGLRLHLSERGRDQYGLYFDLQLSGMRTANVLGGKKMKKRNQPTMQELAPILQRMRYIEPGQFLMGSSANELGRVDRECPQHLVTISQGFWLADTACTQAMWQAVMGNNPAWFNENNGGSAEHPVEQVSLLDVQMFLQTINQLLPQSCLATLPTEAEWEYACRAASSTEFTFGTSITSEQVNYDGNYPYGSAKKGVCRKSTVSVKKLPSNDWGLYQMHGNVWERCFDAYTDYAADQATDPGLAEVVLDGNQRGVCVVRGGSWDSSAQYVRSACRSGGAPDVRVCILGFRFVLRTMSQAKPVF